MEQVNETTLTVRELPVGVWTQTYKEFLETLLAGSEKTPPSIKDYKEFHTDTTVSFTIILSEEQMKEAQAAGLEKKFKIESSVSTANMVLFDPAGRIKKYESPEEILEEFYGLRLTFYQKRKVRILDFCCHVRDVETRRHFKLL
jgi:DNA topoisomerase II